MKKIQLWTVSENEAGQLKAAGVDEVANTETEHRLEEILVASPDLLVPGMQLIARQLPTEGGPLDLLGMDDAGELILFELKRGTLTRDAVAQALDYASDLADRSFDSLASAVEEYSGQNGIPGFDDFADWFAREFPDADDPTEKAPRIVLVGLGVDARALRIVNFLARSGVDVQLLTFHGFSVDGSLFLARQMESEEPAQRGSGEGAPTKQQNREHLFQLAEQQGVRDLLVEVSDFINARMPGYRYPGKTAYSFSLQERTAEGKPTLRSYLVLYVHQKRPRYLMLSMHERAEEAAPEATRRFLDQVPGSSRDEDRYPVIQVEFDREDWQKVVRAELDVLLEQLVRGWKAKLDRMEEDAEGV